LVSADKVDILHLVLQPRALGCAVIGWLVYWLVGLVDWWLVGLVGWFVWLSGWFVCFLFG
jgi:hypothetical protein